MSPTPHEEKRHEQLIKEAKEAYAKTKSVGMTRTPGMFTGASALTTAVISDPEDPNFDLEKLVNYWAKE
ncbi:hypothetical protein MVES_001236 [Malassezia vespertilionis]|uniref:Uncharacterized protein n=1 Tax=Malassezia vespertilionis TaxID=2020962 RepID=A0A2N1JES2_9BASI|nr:hypothetical protein MVES_001236 [Malassezia vespertilionis]